MDYTKHIMANTAHGIHTIDPVDYPEADYYSFYVFMSKLRNLGDEEAIFCAVDPDEYAEIDEEYGIDDES